jgi:hypothetical protein
VTGRWWQAPRNGHSLSQAHSEPHPAAGRVGRAGTPASSFRRNSTPTPRRTVHTDAVIGHSRCSGARPQPTARESAPPQNVVVTIDPDVLLLRRWRGGGPACGQRRRAARAASHQGAAHAPARQWTSRGSRRRGNERSYASRLAGFGHRTHLVDPVPMHLEHARGDCRQGRAIPGVCWRARSPQFQAQLRSWSFSWACSTPSSSLARDSPLREARRVTCPKG